MQTSRLGATGPITSRFGLGCMGMSDFYGPADETESIATLHAAIEAGITLLDTGDFYGMGHNEMLIARALANHPRDKILLSVKFGAQRGPDGSWLGFDTSPAAVKTALAYTLKRLNTDYIDIYRPSRVDPAVPIEDTIGAIKDMIDAGYVRHIGLSEAGAATLRRAAATHPIVDLQIEYAVITRGIEAEILPAARELGIAITAYGVLARGLISGHWSKAREAAPDYRETAPRFAGENLEHNLKLVEALRAVAAARKTSVATIAIAWALAQGPDILPVIGARRRTQWAESSAAADLTLTPADLAAIEAAVPKDAAKGERYPSAVMAHLDSEKKA